MNLHDITYSKYHLIKEMLETTDIVLKIDAGRLKNLGKLIEGKKGLFFTGEGSSRIFPAARARSYMLKKHPEYNVQTEGALQALEYDLSKSTVLAASNSGKTSEAVQLFTRLKNTGHDSMFALTAHHDTPLGKLAHNTHVLSCGNENAVAATKSVIEQALVYDIMLRSAANDEMPDTKQLAALLDRVLTLDIDADLIKKIIASDILYFSGRNDGVAEELALKTNEITRKKSAYLEGTYAAHGIEEVMTENETVVLIDPYQNQEEKFMDVLRKGVGINIIAIAARETLFPTIVIPELDEMNEYLQLAAGWNLLVETGIRMDINLDQPVRARKIGNEFTG